MKLLESIIKLLDKSMYDAKEDNPWADSIEGKFTFGNYVISFYMKRGYKEIQVDHISKEIYYENIEDYLMAHSLDFEDLPSQTEPSIWDVNGFRDEADFNRYKYM